MTFRATNPYLIMLRFLVVLCALGALVSSPFASAQHDPGPKPETYLCPNSLGGKAVDCYLEAVAHLYTMCRQVKSIEIIEFGYEHSEEGVNGAKSEYCIDKHKATMDRPYHAALKEALRSHAATERMHELHDLWLKALAELKWVPGETDEQYKARIAKPYEVFDAEAVAVHTALEQPPAKTKAAPAKSTHAAKPTHAAATKSPN